MRQADRDNALAVDFPECDVPQRAGRCTALHVHSEQRAAAQLVVEG